MKRVERQTTVSAPPTEVFAYLADLRNVADWMTGVVSAEQTSEGEMGAGSTALVVRELMGQRFEAPLTVTEFDAPRHVVIGSEVSGVKANVQLDLAPEGDNATELQFAMEIRGSMLTMFMEPMIANAAGSDIDASLERIKAKFAPGP
jgi:carbon monoxide dehydrogenase subunit G